ncbi:hypothetical protein SEA_SAMISTI12_210 [Streptomyces phage Samisti12]|uniref:Uncharacterized protein n=6 Tax=Samistivirus TaxID=2560220 RepID=A0A223G063_9CAUD|nr:hypothetical protein FDI38_gp101 [Streptomyces phage Peebs]YP_009611605.1 hypothetical protein FDI39_gp097 [Streptomyces phage Samisti12]ASR76593.1 hypothetical protein SEA_SUSHI23_206 [Streptomyces phage Sushi23]QAX95898.1 hypothetical protein SEA_TEUTSCH_206 [Streptomyces phage Teutsch]QGH78354.1 hypothetical protein SEA_TRIBUTE_204 [Streptomyces phage Tribute]QRI46154.1 hypothetical protein SEA_CROSS_205 [Streptomyces phage Cross]WDS51961.1 hypothetical protein SEA_PEPPERWOOD_206 [Strep
MEYTLSEAPEGYTWELGVEEGSFMGTEGTTYEIRLMKDGKTVDTRGVFVSKAREADTASYISAMEQSIRMSLGN